MADALIFGAGGHGLVVADAMAGAFASGQGEWQPIAFVDDNETLRGKEVGGLPVFPADAQLPEHGGVIVAIGDNRRRSELWRRLQQQGARFASAIHPSTVIASDVILGEGVMICAGAILNPGSIIGDNVIINTASSLDHHNTIGDHVHVAPGVRTGGNVSIGEGAFVGIGSITLPNRAIGAWATVGASATVTRDVSDGAVVTGTPARERP